MPRELLNRVLADVRRHCEGKGHHEGPGVNNFDTARGTFGKVAHGEPWK